MYPEKDIVRKVHDTGLQAKAFSHGIQMLRWLAISQAVQSECESTLSTNTQQQLLTAFLPSLVEHQNVGSKSIWIHWCYSGLGLG